MKNISKAIRDEAIECEKSSKDDRNSDENRNIFYVVAIILNGIADKVDRKAVTK